MYTNSAYLNNSLIDFMDKSLPLIVGSCGTYRLKTKPLLPTQRPKGRLDFQLLYVASGKAHFFFNGEEQIVTAGHMVIYRPKEPQRYFYTASDRTEVYWVHFTGKDVKNLLRGYGIKDNVHVVYSGTLLEYSKIFKQMIYELQQCRENYPEMLTLLLRQIFILLQRSINKDHTVKNEYLENEIELATHYFNENYNKEINIEEYASSRGMSISYFIRSFKQYMKITPMQYILSLRINNAQILLETTNYSINEIAQLTGHDNALYFSRIFRKQKGISPSGYRKQLPQFM